MVRSFGQRRPDGPISRVSLRFGTGACCLRVASRPAALEPAVTARKLRLDLPPAGGPVGIFRPPASERRDPLRGVVEGRVTLCYHVGIPRLRRRLR